MLYPSLPSPSLQALYQQHHPSALYPLNIPGLSYPRLVQPLVTLEPGEVPCELPGDERSTHGRDNDIAIHTSSKRQRSEERNTDDFPPSKLLKREQQSPSSKCDLDKQDERITKGTVFISSLYGRSR